MEQKKVYSVVKVHPGEGGRDEEKIATKIIIPV